MSSDIADGIAQQDLPLLRRLFLASPELLNRNAGTYRHYLGFLNEYQPPPAVGRYPTPLHYAASLGAIKVVQWLLDHGANASATNTEGETAAEVASTDAVRKAVLGELGPYFREAPRCRVCREEFSLGFRRHHCRACGSSFCGEHSKYFVPLPKWYGDKAQRACFLCYEKWVASRPQAEQAAARQRSKPRAVRERSGLPPRGGSSGAASGAGAGAGAGAGGDAGDGPPQDGGRGAVASRRGLQKERSASTSRVASRSQDIRQRRGRRDDMDALAGAIAARSWGGAALSESFPSRGRSVSSDTTDGEVAGVAAGSVGSTSGRRRSRVSSDGGFPAVDHAGEGGVELSLLSPPKYEVTARRPRPRPGAERTSTAGAGPASAAASLTGQGSARAS